jgi:hypothetical protein
MRNCQPNPELMLDSKTHSRSGPQELPLCEMTFPGSFRSSPKKVAIQLSIFPTATLTFVILVLEKALEKICNASDLFDQ